MCAGQTASLGTRFGAKAVHGRSAQDHADRFPPLRVCPSFSSTDFSNQLVDSLTLEIRLSISRLGCARLATLTTRCASLSSLTAEIQNKLISGSDKGKQICYNLSRPRENKSIRVEDATRFGKFVQ